MCSENRLKYARYWRHRHKSVFCFQWAQGLMGKATMHVNPSLHGVRGIVTMEGTKCREHSLNGIVYSWTCRLSRPRDGKTQAVEGAWHMQSQRGERGGQFGGPRNILCGWSLGVGSNSPMVLELDGEWPPAWKSSSQPWPSTGGGVLKYWCLGPRQGFQFNRPGAWGGHWDLKISSRWLYCAARVESHCSRR